MKFFRDVLDGPLYIVIVIVAIILIMAIIGYFLEKKQKETELKNSIAEIKEQSFNNQENINNDKIVEVDSVQNINESSVTNAEIPDVLNFDDISENFEKKAQVQDAVNTVVTNVTNNSVEISDSVEIPDVDIK